jgi:hypothetical protein
MLSLFLFLLIGLLWAPHLTLTFLVYIPFLPYSACAFAAYPLEYQKPCCRLAITAVRTSNLTEVYYDE